MRAKPFGRRVLTPPATPAVNTVAPSITGTRGGTLTAVPGTWTTGATSISGQWYSEGVATGIRTLAYTDSDAETSVEYRETALPGSVVASGYRGAAFTTLILNGDFAAGGTSWTADGSVAFSSGRANSTSSANIVSQNVGLVTGKTYSVSFDALASAGNRIRVCNNLGGGIDEAIFFPLTVDGNAYSYGGTFSALGPYISLEAEFAVFTGWIDNVVVSDIAAPITAQASGAPGKKKIDISAIVSAGGATGAEYKIELISGKLIQGWTAMSFASQTGTATYNIPDFAYEGQQLRVLVRNVGGTVVIHSTLTAANGYALQQSMRLGMNDHFWNYPERQIPGRDLFEVIRISQDIELPPVSGSGPGHTLMSAGSTFDNYGHWGETYNPAQLYPSVTGTDTYLRCVLNGVQWQRTVDTARSGVAPDPTDPTGAVSGWSRNGYALASTVGLTADGLPTQLPADTNLTISFGIPWYFKTSRYPVTVHCKTEPGVDFSLLSAVNVTLTNKNLTTGTFDLNFSAAPTNGRLLMSRSTPPSGAFFLSGVPTYETGSPANDIGAPYVSTDKLSDFSPFYATRSMVPDKINRKAGAEVYAPTSATNTISGVNRLWKSIAGMASANAQSIIWVNVPDQADNSFIDAMATYYRDNTTATIYVELSNEIWNFAFQQTVDLNTAATAAGLTLFQMYSRKFRLMMARWRTIFAAQPNRLKGVFAWQTVVTTTDLRTALDFESCYQQVDFFSIAPYFNSTDGTTDAGNYTNTPTAIRNAVSANDQSAFNTAADAYLRTTVAYSIALIQPFYDFLPSYSVGKGLSKNAIGYLSYEAGQHIVVNEAAWDAGLGAGMGARASSFYATYKRTSTFGVTEAYYIDQMAAKVPHLMMLFDYCSSITFQGWGHMDRIGNQTDEPYASVKTKALIYNA